MRLVVLASGSGTLLDAILGAGLPVVAVVVDRDCLAVEVAQRHGVDHYVVVRDDYSSTFDRDAYTERLVDCLEPLEPSIVVMAGFGTILGSALLDQYPGKVLNTHPALLPSFKGWHAVRDALAYGVKVTGCTVHVATPEVDEGPILAQEAVTVLPDDDEAALHERIKAVERRLYVDTIRSVIENPSLLKGTLT